MAAMLKIKAMKNIRDNKRFGKQFEYILDCIEGDNYGVTLETDKDKINFVFDCYEKEYKQSGSVAQWLSGLPSCISLDYMYTDIIRIGQIWGFCKNVKQENDFCDRWFNMVAFRLEQMHKMLNK